MTLAMCERSPLGLPHTQNRMSGRPRVAEILLMRSPKTLRVRGDLKTRPKFVCVLLLWGWTVDNFQLSKTVLRGRTGRGGGPEGRAAAQVACEPTAVVSVRWCLCVCARSVRVYGCLCVRACLCALVLVCVLAHTILLTRISVPVQWRCRQSKSRKTLHGIMSWTPRGCQLLHLSSRSMDFRARATCRWWTRRIWWYCAASSSSFKASSCVNGFRD